MERRVGREWMVEVGEGLLSSQRTDEASRTVECGREVTLIAFNPPSHTQPPLFPALTFTMDDDMMDDEYPSQQGYQNMDDGLSRGTKL